VLVWGPCLLSIAHPSPCCFHATYLLQCRRMAFHLTRRRIDYPSTNLWRCSYQVTYHIIITFITYSHPNLSRRHRTAAYILSSARWEKRTQYDMAFCGVSFLTAGYVTSCFSPSLGYPKVPKPHRNIGWLSRVATWRLFLDPIALNVSWGRIYANVLTPTTGSNFYRAYYYPHRTNA
jgi:hypothetical protein